MKMGIIKMIMGAAMILVTFASHAAPSDGEILAHLNAVEGLREESEYVQKMKQLALAGKQSAAIGDAIVNPTSEYSRAAAALMRRQEAILVKANYDKRVVNAIEALPMGRIIKPLRAVAIVSAVGLAAGASLPHDSWAATSSEANQPKAESSEIEQKKPVTNVGTSASGFKSFGARAAPSGTK